MRAGLTSAAFCPMYTFPYFCRLVFSDQCDFQILTEIIHEMCCISLIRHKRIAQGAWLAAFSVGKCEMSWTGGRRQSELLIESEGLQSGCHLSGWDLDTDR